MTANQSEYRRLERDIQAFFAACESAPATDARGEPLWDKNGLPLTVPGRTPTVAGLACALGFETRDAVLNYRGDAGCTRLMRRALLRVEACAEELLFDKDRTAAAKFVLINSFAGWSEKGLRETAPQSDLENALTRLTVQELQALAAGEAAGGDELAVEAGEKKGAACAGHPM
jgi:hypothetical protein